MQQVNVFQYCRDPQRTLMGLSPDERRAVDLSKYDDMCDTIAKANREYAKKLRLDGPPAAIQAISSIIEQLLTAESIALIAADIAVDYTGKAFKQALYRGLARGISRKLYLAATREAAKRGAMHLSRAIMISSINSSIQKAAVAALATAAAKAISVASNVIAVILAIVQVVGTILDIIDYNGYSYQMDGAKMDLVNEQMNDNFADTFLSTLSMRKDKFGVPIPFKGYPVEYRLDMDLIKQTGSDFYNTKILIYSLEYLNNLKYNSLGQQIITKGHPGELPALEEFNSRLKDASRTFAYTVLNSNTVVLNWVRSYWLIVVLALLALLWFLLS